MLLRFDLHGFFGVGTAVMLVVVGCGGVIENGNGRTDGGSGDGSDAGSGDASSDSDGNPGTEGGHPCVGPCALDAGSSGCPSTQPTAGAACPNANLWCEYGSAPNPYCNSLWQCNSLLNPPNDTWEARTSSGIPICPAAGTPCPPSYALAEGTSATCPVEGNVCEYPEGTCLCTRDPGGLPIMNGPIWSCVPLSAGCTSPRPQLGSPCTTPGPLCNYGECSGGVDEQCVDGYWAIASVGCPK